MKNRIKNEWYFFLIVINLYANKIYQISGGNLLIIIIIIVKILSFFENGFKNRRASFLLLRF